MWLNVPHGLGVTLILVAIIVGLLALIVIEVAERHP